jgi:hypothetical protein
MWRIGASQNGSRTAIPPHDQLPEVAVEAAAVVTRAENRLVSDADDMRRVSQKNTDRRCVLLLVVVVARHSNNSNH